MWLLLPFLTIKSGLEYLLTFKNFNAINRNEPITGIKHGAFTTDLDIQAVKDLCKEKECTVNDYTTALLSTTLFEYFDRHKDTEGRTFRIPNYVSLGVPFSLRQPIEKLEEAKIVNELVVLPVDILIRKELEDALPIMKEQFKKLKTSLTPFGSV